MGKNAQRRRGEQITQDMIEEARRASFDRQVLRSLLPHGEEPIATRMDPTTRLVHVACASGKVHTISLADIQRRADPPPIILPFSKDEMPSGPYSLPSDSAREAMRQAFMRQMQRAWESYQGQSSQGSQGGQGDGQGQGQQGESGEQSFEDMWELAEALCDEALAVAKETATCDCHDYLDHRATECRLACTHQAQVRLRSMVWTSDRSRYDFAPHQPFACCEACARKLVETHWAGVALIDWDAEGRRTDEEAVRRQVPDYEQPWGDEGSYTEDEDEDCDDDDNG